MRVKLMSWFLLGLIRLLTGAQARWLGCPPKAEVVPVPVLCPVTFGAPIKLEAGEERRVVWHHTVFAGPGLGDGRCRLRRGHAGALCHESLGGIAEFRAGAGGLLDRVDALCFAAPVFFHSVRWHFDLRP